MVMYFSETLMEKMQFQKCVAQKKKKKKRKLVPLTFAWQNYWSFLFVYIYLAFIFSAL